MSIPVLLLLTLVVFLLILLVGTFTAMYFLVTKMQQPAQQVGQDKQVVVSPHVTVVMDQQYKQGNTQTTPYNITPAELPQTEEDAVKKILERKSRINFDSDKTLGTVKSNFKSLGVEVDGN